MVLLVKYLLALLLSKTCNIEYHKLEGRRNPAF